MVRPAYDPVANALKAREMMRRISAQVVRGAGKGVKAATPFLAARIKETLNVPAPRRRVVSGPGSQRPGEVYYVATVRATSGAPPRKLSGALQRIVNWKVTPDGTTGIVGVNARSPGKKRFNYPRYHEEHDHKFMEPTFERWKNYIGVIIGKAFVSGFAEK